METEIAGPNLEALKKELEEISHRIMQLDAAGDKGPEWNELNNRHEQLTAEIEELSKGDHTETLAA